MRGPRPIEFRAKLRRHSSKTWKVLKSKISFTVSWSYRSSSPGGGGGGGELGAGVRGTRFKFVFKTKITRVLISATLRAFIRSLLKRGVSSIGSRRCECMVFIPTSLSAIASPKKNFFEHLYLPHGLMGDYTSLNKNGGQSLNEAAEHIRMKFLNFTCEKCDRALRKIPNVHDHGEKLGSAV